MNCHSFVNVMDLYVEGRLTARRNAAATAHLASCADCRAKAAPSVSPSTARAPQSLKDKLMAAAKTPHADSPAPAPGLALWPSEARGVALAAALLLLVGLLIAATGVPSQSSGDSLAAMEVP
ncbi:MAG: zf-HC2 domain-containing protein [Elusimicrobia bacterium]|nr:zf-HC2 domain-containing protein [Elusimicrobiota bacterium]